MPKPQGVTTKRINGIDAMKHISSSSTAVLLVHDRESGEDRIVTGKLSVTDTGWAFKRGPQNYEMIGSGGENAWTVISEDPWIVGLRTTTRDKMIAGREPTPEEYNEWRAIFERDVRQ